MNKIFGAVSVMSVAMTLNFASSTPSFAEVIINNVLSPFTTIEVGPGPRAYGPRAWWVNDSRHHQRCYRRWNPYYGSWHMHCVRMYYGGRPNWEWTGANSYYGE
jgi:hypothetical protein